MTKEYIIKTCKKYNIINYIINDDLSINVKDSVYLNNKGLTELPLTFNIVDGVFNCGNNNLTNLKGAPRKCKSFYCYGNKLASLEGAPGECRFFSCSGNNLTTLKDSPKCKEIRADCKKLNLDNEELYVIEALASNYNNKLLKDYLKIKRRSEIINLILD